MTATATRRSNHSALHAIGTVFRRELKGYFATPLAYVFIVIFLVVAGSLTFFVGNFFDAGQANLQAFFNFHPWLYLFLIPALSMRLWAEERKTGTIEMFLTLPITTGEAVLGKFFAAWAFTGIALLLTVPFWISVNVLGRPDNGVIFASYVASMLMAGGFLAIGSCISALTRNQVIAFVLAAAACFVATLSGSSIVLGLLPSWLPAWVPDAVASWSMLTHFGAIIRGVIALSDLVFFLSVIGIALFVNTLLVEMKKAD